jgi:arylsulfatase A-like enzyme
MVKECRNSYETLSYSLFARFCPVLSEFPVKAAGMSQVPFLENNDVLGEVNQYYGGNFLNEESLLEIARQAGFSTAAIGKLGPALIQDITQRQGEPTLIVDDSTGTSSGIPLSPVLIGQLNQLGLPLITPSRGENGKPGNSKTPGTTTANLVQQQFFADVTTKAILPEFKQRKQPFVLVFWSRDPDGTQHNQGDSLNQLVPGINGPTTQASIQNADQNLAQIRQALKDLDLDSVTNLVVTSDHGFSTISKQSQTSHAATLTYQDVPKGFLPPGFLAIDLADGLNLPLFDPDKNNAVVNPSQGQFSKNGLIGNDSKQPEVIVAANGGSDLIYLPNTATSKELVNQLVTLLLKQDYVSGLFIDDALGKPSGTLPLSEIGLKGTAKTPIPSIVVNFRSFDTGCRHPQTCGVIVADTALQQGQGMHGSFSRADTHNTMMAIGPDFKQRFTDRAPASNADLPLTIAKILDLKTSNNGKLVGRVLAEAIAGKPKNIPYKKASLQSQPAANGLKTILKYQVVGQTRYYDVAGFPKRTLGL